MLAQADGNCRSAQVVYPALDAKVRNVTLAYSVEHEDEVSHLSMLATSDSGAS